MTDAPHVTDDDEVTMSSTPPATMQPTTVDADTVLYDGDCQFCTRQADWLRQLDTEGRLNFLSLHDPVVGQQWAELEFGQLMTAMHVIDRTGRVYDGANAFQYLTRRLPRLWAVAPVMHFPPTMWIARHVYAWIAHRRYRWNKTACADGSCAVHFKQSMSD